MTSTKMWTNDVRLGVEKDGRRKEPLMIFLHGFPGPAFTWSKQIASFKWRSKLLAPNQRGYYNSQVMNTIREYHLNKLAGDVVGLIPPGEKAILVGHDFGAAVAWKVANDYPELISHLVVINGPHPSAYSQSFRSSLGFIARNWKFLASQIPCFPEFYLRRNKYEALFDLLPEDYSTNTDLQKRCLEAWGYRSNTLTAMLNWYRSAMLGCFIREKSEYRKLHIPTLIIWGTEDEQLTKLVAQKSAEFCYDFRL